MALDDSAGGLGGALGKAFQGFAAGYTGVPISETEGRAEDRRYRRQQQQFNLENLKVQQDIAKEKLKEVTNLQDNKRLQASALDMRKAAVMFEMGQVQPMVSLLSNRVNEIKRQGGNPEHTEGLLNLARSGDPKTVEALSAAEMSHVASGLLPPRNKAQMELVQRMGMAGSPEIKEYMRAEGGGVVGLTKTGKAIDVDLPEGVKIAEKKDPFAEELGALRLQTQQLQKSLLEGKVSRMEADKQQGEIDRKAKAAEKVGALSSAIDTIDTMLKGEGLESATGLSGIITTLIPGSEASDFSSQLESLKSNIFLENVSKMKGMGALSEAEGRKIAAATKALDIEMSPKLLRKNIKIIRDTFAKGLKKAERMQSAGKLEDYSDDTGAAADLSQYTTEQLQSMLQQAQ